MRLFFLCLQPAPSHMLFFFVFIHHVRSAVLYCLIFVLWRLRLCARAFLAVLRLSFPRLPLTRCLCLVPFWPCLRTYNSLLNALAVAYYFFASPFLEPWLVLYGCDFQIYWTFSRTVPPILLLFYGTIPLGVLPDCHTALTFFEVLLSWYYTAFFPSVFPKWSFVCVE